MDQFGEMSKTKQVVHAETSRSGASGKRTLYRLYNNFNVEIMLGSKIVMKVLLGVLVVELQAGKFRMVTKVFV